MGARFGRLGGVHTWSEDGQATVGYLGGSMFLLLDPCSTATPRGLDIVGVGLRLIRRRVHLISEVGKVSGACVPLGAVRLERSRGLPGAYLRYRLAVSAHVTGGEVIYRLWTKC